MNDEQTPPSGSRWEPARAQGGIAPPTERLPTDARSADGDRDGDSGGGSGRGTGTRTRRPGRTVLVGAGLALLLGGGAGGFALGRAVAGGGGTAVPTSGIDGRRPGLDGWRVDDGRPGGDRNGDGDHGGFATPPDGTAPGAGTEGSTT